MKFLERFWYGCGHCHGAEQGDGPASCPLMQDAQVNRWLDPEGRRFSQGGALVLAATTVFLLPLATAIGGAFVGGRYLAPASHTPVWAWQAIGMVAGLALGVGLAKLVLWLLRPRESVSGGGDG